MKQVGFSKQIACHLLREHAGVQQMQACGPSDGGREEGSLLADSHEGDIF